jgi:predicted TIM-barrel fold metal-dependent hydrolase
MVSRREFLEGSLGAGLVLATQGCGSIAGGGASRRIVDSQVHLWKAESPDWRWVPNATPQLPEPFTIERFAPMMDEAGVERAIIVPPSWVGDRNDYALEAAKRYPGRFAVMGRFPVRDPKSAALLAGWKQQPGMLGVRLTFLGPTAAWLSDGSIDWFWPAAEKAGIPVMFLTGAGVLSRFVPIAERHPGLTLIIDHMNLSTEAVQKKTVSAEIDQVVALAKFPNVSCKVSASPLASVEAYPFRDMSPIIRRVFDAYGPRRSYWGTDITNSLAKATYRQRITQFTETLDFLSEEDKDWVMGRAILARLGWA